MTCVVFLQNCRSVIKIHTQICVSCKIGTFEMNVIKYVTYIRGSIYLLYSCCRVRDKLANVLFSGWSSWGWPVFRRCFLSARQTGGYRTNLTVPGHFAERHFAERHFAERHFAERTFCRRTLSRTDILSNRQYDERTFRRKDILLKRQLAENREILGIVTHFSKMCNSQSLCNYKITIVRSLPYISA